MNPYYRTSHSQDADSSWVNDNWDRSTALTIQHQGSHSDWDWESQINISQKSSGVVGNEVAEKSPVLHHSYAIPSSYHNIHSESLTTNSSGYCQNAAISSLPSVRSCGLLESLQGIMHTSSLYVNPMSAFSGYTAGSGVSHADFRSFDQSSRILAGIVDVEQKSYCDLIKRSGIYQTELHEALGLNLGGRTYFSANDYSRLGKRPHMMNSPGVHVPSCQAEGCIADMSRAKHYYRRHKVCEQHSKASHIFANGQAQRFCQQCSRLHPVAEFDDAKRSCRKRLADHNRRRRKPLMIGSNLSKDYVDQFAQKAEGSNQNVGIKDSETGSPTYSIEESASDPTMTSRKQLEHETSAFGISGTDNSVTRIKQAASLVSAASWVPSTTNVSGQLQMIKPQVQAADLYKQKLLENIPKDSYLSLTSIRRGSDSTGINFERDLSNDIPCAAPWLAQSGQPKSGAYRKSFVNFQDSVNKSDSALLACYISTSKSVPSSPRTDPLARPLHEFTKDVGCSSQWMIHSSTEQKLYNKQLGQFVAHGNSDEIGDAAERTPSLSVIQASVDVHEDSQQKVRTQSSNLVAVDFLQQQSNTNPDELDSSCVQPKQADDSDSKFAILQALRSFESSTYNPPTTFVL